MMREMCERQDGEGGCEMDHKHCSHGLCSAHAVCSAHACVSPGKI